MTLSADNLDHYPAAFAAARREVPDLRHDEFHVNIVHESPHYLGNTDLGLAAQVDRERLPPPPPRPPRPPAPPPPPPGRPAGPPPPPPPPPPPTRPTPPAPRPRP